MTADFVYDALASRVVFGAGRSLALRQEVERLGVDRIVLIAGRQTKRTADAIAAPLGARVVARFEEVVQHVPVEKAAAAVALARECGADGVITVGGGSATGFGKAVSLELDVRHLAVPTTYAGSEMTPIWGRTRDGRKETGSDRRVLPDVVVYDPELTRSLPPQIAGPSGMNALAHAVEATYAPKTNPVVHAVALESIRRLHRSLPAIAARPDDLEAHSEALLGAYLAACALAVAGTALHHKACHVLGGMFDLGHGEMNSVILPHALHYNTPAIPSVVREIARALETEDVPGALYDLADRIGSPTSLAAIGMPEDGIARAAEEITERAAENVRSPDVGSIRTLLESAFAGRRPKPQ